MTQVESSVGVPPASVSRVRIIPLRSALHAALAACCALLLIPSAAGCSGTCAIHASAPLAPAAGNGGKVLLVVAHQDDDAFIVSRLRHHVLAGDSVFVLWTAYTTFPDTGAGNTRIREAREAMALLGIPPSCYSFLRFPDGETDLYACAIAKHIRDLVLRIRPAVVYVPAFEGGHIDHDIAHVATVFALKEAHWECAVREFPIYSAFHFVPFLPFVFRNLPDTPATDCRELSGEEYSFVLRYWATYRSQQFPLDPFMALLPGHRIVFGREYIRDVPAYDYLKEPDGGPIAYGRFLRGVSFADFQRAVRQLMTGCNGHDDAPGTTQRVSRARARRRVG